MADREREHDVILTSQRMRSGIGDVREMERDHVVRCHRGLHRASFATEGLERPSGGHLTWGSDVTFYGHGSVAACLDPVCLFGLRHRVRGLGLDVSRYGALRPESSVVS